jgi:hypothetical protein
MTVYRVACYRSDLDRNDAFYLRAPTREHAEWFLCTQMFNEGVCTILPKGTRVRVERGTEQSGHR